MHLFYIHLILTQQKMFVLKQKVKKHLWNDCDIYYRNYSFKLFFSLQLNILWQWAVPVFMWMSKDNNLCVNILFTTAKTFPTNVWLTFDWADSVELDNSEHFYMKSVNANACCLRTRIANVFTMNVHNTIAVSYRDILKKMLLSFRTLIPLLSGWADTHLWRLFFGGIHWLNSYSAKFSLSSFHTFNKGSFTLSEEKKWRGL